MVEELFASHETIMGQFITLKPDQIKPSQDFLKKGTVDFILECYKNGVLDALPPPPLVRRDPAKEGEYIAIDGHNLLAVHQYGGTECEVYCVDSAEDFFPNPQSDPAITQRNKDLSDKFESCVDESRRVRTSFEFLIHTVIS